ncbi:ribonuclease E inhibitor RraB [Coralloluteibacterium thermophilus]|uniref:Ribonuclease E inhibitor RraB n=1 Tax=Coralloluteibacterium thermophilum TaxID=2707049 RepID=A0ABV9NKJ4_9GAMM
MSRTLRIVQDARVGAPAPPSGDGDTLLQAAEVEFVFAFTRRAAAGAFVEAVELLSEFRVEPPFDRDDGWHRARVLRVMVPRQAEVAACVRRLAGIAEPFGGLPDSWGCIQVDRLN